MHHGSSITGWLRRWEHSERDNRSSSSRDNCSGSRGDNRSSSSCR